jgi:predicted NBD/HSP70 family sugar kinase
MNFLQMKGVGTAVNTTEPVAEPTTIEDAQDNRCTSEFLGDPMGHDEYTESVDSDRMREFERLLGLSSLTDLSEFQDAPQIAVPANLVQRVVDRARTLGETRYAIGIELLPYRMVGALSDEHGRRLADAHRRLEDMSVEAVVEAAAALVRDLIAAEPTIDIGSSKIGLCLQLGGPVDSRAGRVKYYHKTPPVGAHAGWGCTWRDEPLAALLSEATGLPAVVDNDAIALAAYQQWFGAGRDVADWVLMLVREGVGGAVVENGRITRFPAEIGQLILHDDGRECGCGRKGCLEAAGGISGILAEVHDHTQQAIEGIVAAAELTTENGAGEKALAAFARAGTTLAHGIGWMATLFGPTRIVLYLPPILAERGTPGSAKLLSKAEQFTEYTHEAYNDVELRVEGFGPFDGAHGAALLALERHFGILAELARPNAELHR